MKTNELTHLIIGKAIEVHRILGSGLLESAYQECLFYELTLAGLIVEKEVSMPIRLYHEKLIMQLNDLLRLHFVAHQSCSYGYAPSSRLI